MLSCLAGPFREHAHLARVPQAQEDEGQGTVSVNAEIARHHTLPRHQLRTRRQSAPWPPPTPFRRCPRRRWSPASRSWAAPSRRRSWRSRRRSGWAPSLRSWSASWSASPGAPRGWAGHGGAIAALQAGRATCPRRPGSCSRAPRLGCASKRPNPHLTCRPPTRRQRGAPAAGVWGAQHAAVPGAARGVHRRAVLHAAPLPPHVCVRHQRLLTQGAPLVGLGAACRAPPRVVRLTRRPPGRVAGRVLAGPEAPAALPLRRPEPR